jgi:chemotaxis protein CheD
LLTPLPNDLPIFTPVAGMPAAEPVYVPPGRLHAAADAKPLTTIVSTGAVVCVWDPVSGAGGMTHFLLPESGTAPPAPRFGDVALRTLVQELVRLGASERHMRARVYGGSAPPVTTEGSHLGDRNVQAAISFLESHNVAIVAREVGGTGARKVLFSPNTGLATVSRISPN